MKCGIRLGDLNMKITPLYKRSIAIHICVHSGNAAKSDFHNHSLVTRRLRGIMVNPPPTRAAAIAASRVNEIRGLRTTSGPESSCVAFIKSISPPKGTPCKTGSCRHRSHACCTIWCAIPLPRSLGSTSTVASSMAPPILRSSAYPAISPSSRMRTRGVFEPRRVSLDTPRLDRRSISTLSSASNQTAIHSSSLNPNPLHQGLSTLIDVVRCF